MDISNTIPLTHILCYQSVMQVYGTLIHNNIMCVADTSLLDICYLLHGSLYVAYYISVSSSLVVV